MKLTEKYEKIVKQSKAVTPVIGDKISFGAAEAYKLLRTNLLFSLPENHSGCYIIGVTSSLEGEGKSTTVINTCYSIVQTDKKVLIIDCDMRKPVMSKYLNVDGSLGISNVLIGAVRLGEVIKKSALHENLSIIPVGDIPPNPSELLGSEKMKDVLDVLVDYYDYIVLDLPPVNAVTDALVVSKYIDGMLVVVREDYCVQDALEETVRQLKFLNVKVLGFVVSRGVFEGHGYYRYGKYSRYRKHNYSKYKQYASHSYKYGGYYGQPYDAKQKNTSNNSDNKVDDKL